jgi:hypothetical protein
MAAAAALACTPASANDSTAEVAAGGLVLTKTDAIEMVSEDLFVSAEAVRVDYVFRNRTSKDVETIVAFPLPDRDFTTEFHGDVARPDGFTTTVDGRAVKMAVEQKALVRGKDHSAVLHRLGIPVAGSFYEVEEALNRLPQAARREVVRLGLAVEEDLGSAGKPMLQPAWSVKETWHWRQRFPAGRALKVAHRYRPGTGGSVGSPLAVKDFRRSPEGKRLIAAYCADAAFLAGVDRMAKVGGGEYPILPEQRIGYILKTGGNWAAPIARFRLVVDKGAPDNLVSFCGAGLRKISPTRFEMVRINWRPDRDLDILIVHPAPVTTP